MAEQVNGDKYYFFKRQVIFALGGGVALWGAALLPRHWLYRMQYPALFLALALLLVTLSPLTPAINGAKRWIPLGFISIQPMEFVKIALALYLAYFMSSKQNSSKPWCYCAICRYGSVLLFCCFCSLTSVAAPLFWPVFCFLCAWLAARFIYLFFSVALACAGAMALAISSPYRLRRLLAFLILFQDAHNTGY